MNIFKHLFGFLWQKDTQVANREKQTRAPVAAVAMLVRRVVFHWQEMLDTRSRLCGYILRPSTLFPGDRRISGPDLREALEAEGIARLIERRRVIVPVTPEQFRSADFRGLCSTNTSFLISSNDAPDWDASAWRVFASVICAAGGHVIVDLPIFQSVKDGKPFADSLLLNMDGSVLRAFEKQIRTIRRRHPQIQVIVDGVSSWEEFRLLKSLGVSFCMGGFASSVDAKDQSGQVSRNRLVVIEMLNMLRDDAELSSIAAVAKRDPAIVIKLLQMANSPLSGLPRQVAALEDAIILLGRDELYRWLSLAMFRIDARDDIDETLLVIALSRAGFLERLAPDSDRQMACELFLVGLFSLIDRLLSMPVEKVLQQIHLPEPVATVLLRSEGPYARYLLLALAMERGLLDSALTFCTKLDIDSVKMLNAYRASMTWANSDIATA